MANSLYYHQPKQEAETCFLPLFQPLNPQISYNHLNRHETSSDAEISTLTATSSSYDCVSTANQSPAAASKISHQLEHQLCSSPDNSTCYGYGSPTSGSCITTDDMSHLKHKLIELETAMLGPDTTDPNPIDTAQIPSDSWGRVFDMIARKDLKRVLVACAQAVSDNDHLMIQWLMDELRHMVSVSGDPIQRLGAYMLEGLVARQNSSGSSIYKAQPPSSDLLSYMHILYEVCPYIKFGYMSANGAIAEAMKDERCVHIIDFQICQGSQWVPLIQAFGARPGGPPRIRLTGIDDVYSAQARGGGLRIVGQRLSRLAELFKVPFEFHGVAVAGSQVELKDLTFRTGEALAVNFAFALHHTPDESVTVANHRDRILRLVKSLSPKVVTLVEQECNTNSAAFFPRFVETLDYYTAMFESMDVTLPREHKDRINVEQHCLARDVVNLIACEGAERVERQELLGKWRLRFIMAGFEPYPLSSLVNTTIKMLLKSYCDKYRLEEKDGALYLGWMNRNLVASCAWQCRRNC